MKNNFFKPLKYSALVVVILLSNIACEKDFEDVGVSLVDNNLFNTKDTVFKIVAYNEDILKSRVDGIPVYLIGVQEDQRFGKFNAAFVSQLGLPSKVDFGDNVSIDTIILDIPYFATRIENYSGGKPQFELDSVQGDEKFILSVYELGTFLNTLDPLDPTKRKKYYSNESYTKKVLLYSGDFQPDKNDTVLKVKRSFFDNEERIDTIKKEKLNPSIKIPLDTTFFRTNFIDKDEDPAFSSSDNFIDYFRGIYIDVERIVDKKGSMMTLKMSDATVTIYYTHTKLKDETDTDLNGDGDTEDKNVPVRIKTNLAFPIQGIRTNVYNKNYAGSEFKNYKSPSAIDKEKGVDKLFIQGASGSMGILELFKGFKNTDFDRIKQENWLINEANITLYLDEDQSIVPEKLLLYNYHYNSQLFDVFREAQVIGIGGNVERNADDNNKAVKYKFRITNYINKILKAENQEKELEIFGKLGLKVLNTSDIPDFNVANDTIVTDFSWKAKGVVLRGNNLTIKDKDSLKLEIFYTRLNK